MRARNLLLTAVAIACLACNGDSTDEGDTPPPPPPPPPAAVVVALVRVTPNAVALTPTTSQQFAATAHDSAGGALAVTLTWSSSADHIASVSDNGLAAGVQAGSARIRASAPNGVFAEATVSVTAPPPPDLNLAGSQRGSEVSRAPTASVQVPPFHKLIGCGARVNFDVADPGLYLTAVYPSDARTCTANARDHIQPTNGTIEVWAFSVIDPLDQWQTIIVSSTQPGTTATVTLPPGYALTGGGGRITSTGAGVLMTATRPSGTSWITTGKAHVQPDTTGTVTSYVIGLKPRNGAAPPTTLVTFQQSNSLEARATVQSGYTLIGGGAAITFNGPGRLLMSSFPENATWVARGQQHLLQDQGTITAYVIGIR